MECCFRSSIFNLPINQVINVGTGTSTGVKKLIDMILKKIPGTTYHLSKSTKGDQNLIVGDNTLLKSKLKIKKFINLEQGLELFLSTL